MKLLMYGAGSIGRGFIGPLFAQSGFEVVFVDIDCNIIDALNKRRSYHYTVASDVPYDISVENVRGVYGDDTQAISKEVATCDIMATSLGGAILQKVSPIIASGFSLRMSENRKPLNILICENLKDAAHQMHNWLIDSLPEGDKPLLDKYCGLIEAAIGRMVPIAVPNQADPLHVTVEEYSFLPVDKAAFVGNLPDVKGLFLYSPFAFYEERKLYLHNMGHSISAYLGMLQGHDTIAQSISDPIIRLLVQNAMIESSAMLSQKHSIPFIQIYDHAEDLLFRFGNSALGDTCERVGRDPLRKLHFSDRLAGALHHCWEYEVHPVYIALGYAAALKSITEDINKAEEIASEVGKLQEAQMLLVMNLFSKLGKPDMRLLQIAEQIKKELRGDVV